METQDYCLSNSCEKLVIACVTRWARDLEHRPIYKSRAKQDAINLVNNFVTT